MELQIYMLDVYDDYKIAEITGINVKTVTDWRKFVKSLGSSKRQEKKVPVASMLKRKEVNFTKERQFQKYFVNTLREPCEEYYRVEGWFIDVLTKSHVYELKLDLHNSVFQKAVGQVLMYRTFFPERQAAVVANAVNVPAFYVDRAGSIGVKVIEFT